MRLSETKEALKENELDRKNEKIRTEPLDLKRDIQGVVLRMKDETEYKDRTTNEWKKSPAGIQITSGKSFVKISALQLRGIKNFMNEPEFSSELDKRADAELKSLTG